MTCASVLERAGIIESQRDLHDFDQPAIRTRYRRWALVNHPDKSPGNEEVFKRVRGCYEQVGKEAAEAKKRPERAPERPHRKPSMARDDDDDSLVREFERRYGHHGAARPYRSGASYPWADGTHRRPRGGRGRTPFPWNDYDDDELVRRFERAHGYFSRYSGAPRRGPHAGRRERSSGSKATRVGGSCTCITRSGGRCKIPPSTRGASTCHAHRRTGCTRG